MTLNCLGDMCPIPLLKADAAVKKLPSGESLLLITDHSCVVESIREHFSSRNCRLNIHEAISGVWEITIIRHPPLKPMHENRTLFSSPEHLRGKLNPHLR